MILVLCLVPVNLSYLLTYNYFTRFCLSVMELDDVGALFGASDDEPEEREPGECIPFCVCVRKATSPT